MSAELIELHALGSAVLRRRSFSWTPSIVPNGQDQNVIPVVDGFDRGDFLFRETRLDHTDLETVISDLLSGQYNDPQLAISFNTGEHWSQDVSEDIAREIQKQCDLQLEDVPQFLADFVAKNLDIVIAS